MYFSMRCPIDDIVKISVIQDHTLKKDVSGPLENPPVRLVLGRRPLWKNINEIKALNIVENIATDAKQTRDRYIQDIFGYDGSRKDLYTFFELFSEEKDSDNDSLNSFEASSISEDHVLKDKMTDEEKKKYSSKQSVGEKGKEMLGALLNPVQTIKDKKRASMAKMKSHTEQTLDEKFGAVKQGFRKDLKYVTGKGQSQENTILLQYCFP